MKPFYYINKQQKKEQPKTFKGKVMAWLDKATGFRLPAYAIIIICVMIFFFILQILDSHKAASLVISNENVAYILLDWSAKNDALNYLIFLLIFVKIWKNWMLRFNKKPQGKLRGVR